MREYHYIPCAFFVLLTAVSLPSGAEPAADVLQEDLGDEHTTCEVEVMKPPAPVVQKAQDAKKKPAKKRKRSRMKGRTLGDLTVTLADYGNANWQYPISPVRTAGSGFGRRESPINKGHWVFHGGQDIGCRSGERIYAAADGIVRVSMYSKTAGNFIVLKHVDHNGSLIETRYLHLSRRYARRGKHVQAGDVIGRCGNTGQSTSAHLHFEVKRNGRTVNPFRAKTSEETTSYCDNLLGGPNDIFNAECAMGEAGAGAADAARQGEHSRL